MTRHGYAASRQASVSAGPRPRSAGHSFVEASGRSDRTTHVAFFEEQHHVSSRACRGPRTLRTLPGRTSHRSCPAGVRGLHGPVLPHPLGGRTAVGFTSAAKLTATLGADHPHIKLSEPALRALAAPLGVTALVVDPSFSAPAVDRAAATVRERENSWRRWHPEHVGALRVTGAAAVVACLNLLIG